MNKEQLTNSVAEAADISKTVAAQAVNAVIESITDALKNGQTVTLVGFGTFGVKSRAAREGRNPQTGKTIKIEAANIPGFKAGKALKEAVN